MAEIIRIQDIAQCVGEQVTLQGWIYHRTGKGKLQFLQLRDGTGFVQCVVFKNEVSPEVFEAAQHLTQESSVTVTGSVSPPGPFIHSKDICLDISPDNSAKK